MISFLDILFLHGGAILFAGVTTYTIAKCLACGDFIEIYTDDEDETCDKEQK